MPKPQHVDKNLWVLFFNSFSLILQGNVLYISNRSFEQYQEWDHDEMLEEWPTRKTNLYWIEKSA